MSSILLCNQNWFREELESLGFSVLTIGARGRELDLEYPRAFITAEELLNCLPTGFVPDFLIYYDDSSTPWIGGLYRLKIPSVFYSVDSHHHASWHRYFGACFDHVFVAQKDHLDEFRTILNDSEWMPLWSPLTLIPRKERPIDVSFRGNFDPKLHPERVRFFEELKKTVAVDAGQGPYDEVYTASKIVINQAVKNDFNFRVFEGLMSGALLITPYVENGMTDLFIPGIDLITYENNNVKEAAEKINYFLTHDDERLQIARSGYSKVAQFHTKAARARGIAKLLSTIKVSERRLGHFGCAIGYLCRALSYPLDMPLRPGQFFNLVIDELIESAKAEEYLTAEFENMVVFLKQTLEEREFLDAAARLVKSLREVCPHNLIFSMAYIENIQKHSIEA